MNFSDFDNNLKVFAKEKIIFVALGNSYRGDDGAGLMFIEHLRKSKEYRSSVYIDAGTNPENHLMEILSHKPSAVVFVDSAKSNFQKDISWIAPEKIDSSSISTHAFSMDLIRQYLLLNNEIEIRFLGIPAGSFGFGEKISGSLTGMIEKFFTVKDR